MALLTCAEFRVLRDQIALADYAQRYPTVCAHCDDYRRQIAALRYEKHDPATSRHRQQAIDAEIYTLAWKLRPYESERLGILADTPARCKRLGLGLPEWYPGEVVKPIESVTLLPAYRALSLWQPWATLVALGQKHYETRHWSTNYRGLLAIHAAKRKPTREDMAVCPHLNISDIPLGAVLCIVRLVDVVRVETIRDSLSADERRYGNYSDRRYAWQMEVVQILEKPVPAKGEQGFWKWKAA